MKRHFTEFPWRVLADGVELFVRLTPNASRANVIGVVDGQLRVAVTASPDNGQANEALLRYLSAELRLPYSTLTIMRGLKARQKSVKIIGLADDLIFRLQISIDKN